MVSQDFSFPVSLAQGSMSNAKKLLALRIKASKTSSTTPKFKSEENRRRRGTMVKVMKNKTPETRALSSMAVESARKARQDGKPSPKDAPKSALKSRENNTP